MDILGVLVFVVVVIFGWGVLRGLLSKSKNPEKPEGSTAKKAASSPREFHWEGKGDFDFPVVGESNYQRALAKFAGVHGKERARAKVCASLFLEDSNRYDPQAVAIQVESVTVGYLSREDARSYRRRLGQKGLTGVNATCDALIVGGGKNPKGETLFYGIQLDIKPFDY